MSIFDGPPDSLSDYVDGSDGSGESGGSSLPAWFGLKTDPEATGWDTQALLLLSTAFTPDPDSGGWLPDPGQGSFLDFYMAENYVELDFGIGGAGVVKQKQVNFYMENREGNDGTGYWTIVNSGDPFQDLGPAWMLELRDNMGAKFSMRAMDSQTDPLILLLDKDGNEVIKLKPSGELATNSPDGTQYTSTIGLDGSGAASYLAASGDQYAYLASSPAFTQLEMIGKTGQTQELLGLYNGFVEINEITAPAAPGSDNARMFVRDNGSGKTQLCARFPTGAIQVIATEP